MYRKTVEAGLPYNLRVERDLRGTFSINGVAVFN